jgi:hypothetical protein
MSDVYVYHFIEADGIPGSRVSSKQRATLETIKGKGEPVMESQIVVDHTELDRNGFLFDSIANAPMDDLADEIRSLKLRADSRDSDALELDESTAGEHKYMLSLESRELRNQARRLQKRHSVLAHGELAAEDSGNSSDTQSFAQFGDSPAVG